MQEQIEAQELAEAIYRALERHSQRGIGQAIDVLTWLAAQNGIDPRNELPRRLSQLRRQGLIPSIRSTRAAAVHEARSRAEAVARAAASEYLSQ